MFNQWIIDQLKKHEATEERLRSPCILAIERVYGKEHAKYVAKLFEQAKQGD